MNSTHTKADLHKQIKAHRKVIKNLTREKDNRSTRKPFDYGKLANVCMAICLTISISLSLFA